ncbi:hypothetical protein [Amycolatopsis suaedae]|uniref:hypothetical protein n=1 Tax=Amycolatopsis suaedae TaxID=2510978 RepID=UPI0013EF1914|nr:hypothetical protein [Amycolatopsis suaedae]
MRCRDGADKRATVRIAPANGHVGLEPSVDGPLRFTPMQTGQLRAALREAIALLELP